MNIWFIAALLCALGAPLFGYIGTQEQSNEDNKGLEQQFNELGEKIDDLNSSDEPIEAKIVEVKEEYAKLADEYFESRHQKAAKIIAEKSSNIATQLKKSQKARDSFNELHQTTLNIVEAYNEKLETTKLKVVRTNVADNLFVPKAAERTYIGISTETERWAIRLDILEDDIRYEFGKLETRVEDYKNMESFLNPFDILFSVSGLGSEELRLYHRYGNSQEASYFSENLPKTNSQNVLAETIVLKIVELLLLPSINE